MEKENITVIGTVRRKDIKVMFPRPTIVDDKTGIKYDLPCNVNGESIVNTYSDKKVCIEGYEMKPKIVGNKVYRKLWVESITEVK